VTKREAGEVIKGLAPAARAFEAAKRKGYVWIGEQGFFETHESEIGFWPEPPPNPDQLRLE
jgi:hypothetical protein